MDIFEFAKEQNLKKEAPLAGKMRPRTIDEVVGQEDILGEGKMLRRAIEADRIGSLIFYGPPGCGKTTLAKVIANTTKAEFKQLNATISGKKDMEEVVEGAKKELAFSGRKTILFIDEIHRFNKAQQDFLLPYVEDGTITLIGATTENPFFEVNKALISRSNIFRLTPLSKENVKTLINIAVNDKERGLGGMNAVIDDDAVEFLSDIANGDARNALNGVELAIMTTPRSEDGKIHITLEVAGECVQQKTLKYDKDGDNHYDTISAFIKSMRGSDPDAAEYYLIRMLEAGESITFIARRMMIFASEDIGNADPMALNVAVSAALAVERVGLPESYLILSHAAIYLACAPKSNACTVALEEVTKVVHEGGNLPIPPHLRDAHYPGAAEFGHGTEYKYPHNYENHYVKEQYLPYELKDMNFYKPGDLGYETKIKEHFKKIKKDK
ncbi:MAG: replication-associated recombination protein A [Lachnospiraceae bacterium]|nr:replication-associated recombination protein A [Lachnospiraceae bacterium]